MRTLDNIHSVYVDQWDWEKVIAPRDRTEGYLKETVQHHCPGGGGYPDHPAGGIPPVDRAASGRHSGELCHPPRSWRTASPELTPKQREDAWVKEHPTTFLMGIGGKLKSGKPHDGRAPDYDDWTLNGDILMWNPVLGRAFEISSMGIRVSPESLDRQLTLAGCDGRRELPFHKMLLEGKLPLTMGGGIGQSRLCMLLLGKAHIGEVQASIWDEETIHACEEAGVILL